MYMMKLPSDLVNEMYLIREELRESGIKKPITKQVRESIEIYVNDFKKN